MASDTRHSRIVQSDCDPFQTAEALPACPQPSHQDEQTPTNKIQGCVLKFRKSDRQQRVGS